MGLPNLFTRLRKSSRATSPAEPLHSYQDKDAQNARVDEGVGKAFILPPLKFEKSASTFSPGFVSNTTSTTRPALGTTRRASSYLSLPRPLSFLGNTNSNGTSSKDFTKLDGNTFGQARREEDVGREQLNARGRKRGSSLLVLPSILNLTRSDAGLKSSRKHHRGSVRIDAREAGLEESDDKEGEEGEHSARTALHTRRISMSRGRVQTCDDDNDYQDHGREAHGGERQEAEEEAAEHERVLNPFESTTEYTDVASPLSLSESLETDRPLPGIKVSKIPMPMPMPADSPRTRLPSPSPSSRSVSPRLPRQASSSNPHSPSITGFSSNPTPPLQHHFLPRPSTSTSTSPSPSASPSTSSRHHRDKFSPFADAQESLLPPGPPFVTTATATIGTGTAAGDVRRHRVVDGLPASPAKSCFDDWDDDSGDGDNEVMMHSSSSSSSRGRRNDEYQSEASTSSLKEKASRRLSKFMLVRRNGKYSN